MEATQAAKGCVLVVEDDAGLRFALTTTLRAQSYEVFEADGREAASRLLRTVRPDVALLDLCVADGESIDLLPVLRGIDPTMSIYIVTGHGTIDAAVRAVKAGADDFLTKPIAQAQLHEIVANAMARRARSSSSAPTGPVSSTTASLSPAMRALEDEVHRLRNSECSVLILGETGTGKSALARRLHALGARPSGPMVEVNCGGLTKELVESELFGHERGAFTGAHAAKAGLFDAANGGTLFLDEIGDIDLQVQPKLLKALEEKRYRRVGDVAERSADVRLIAATHRDLLGAVADKSFRADLFYRISTVTLVVPPLRERREDLPVLAREMVIRFGGEEVEISPAALARLEEHSWPGNIRELSNVIERALLVRRGPQIQPDDLRFQVAERAPHTSSPNLASAGGRPVSDRLVDVEIEHLRAALAAENWRVEAAAKRLGIPRSTMYWKIKHHGLRRDKDGR